ncbi:MAG: MopE-related protein [Pseudomonadota bacterium]
MTLRCTHALLLCAPLLLATACGEKEPEDTGTSPVDADGDGYAADSDCDDADAHIHPGATEVCDGLDDDCDGVIDDGAGDLWYRDADGDGYGDPEDEVLACAQPTGFIVDDTDCDDGDAEVHPGAAERCNDTDDDCDGEVDEHPTTTWYADTDGDGFGNAAYALNACDPSSGWVADATDCDDLDEDIYPGAPERCNEVDDDCDGDIDEDLATTWYADADGDGYGDPATTSSECDPGSGWVEDDTDCDDGDAATSPGADEHCDGLDNDCDGAVDDEDDAVVDQATWYLDADGDGYGLDSDTAAACVQPSGYTALGGDCDDTDTAFNPGASETDCADPNDYNCDGSVGYTDGDGDGFAACEECDDTDAATFPGADERCDGADNDCDGDVDEDDAVDAPTWYGDADGDGYGDAAGATVACAAPTGSVSDGTDCDDADAAVHPGAAEVCDTLDNDCDGDVDDADAGVTGQTTWYADVDGDGWGDGASATDACFQPTGHVTDDTDCDDAASAVNPAATELCDGVDNDCDGATDEADAADAATWYADADADGYGDPARGTVACTQPTGSVGDGTDCDDHDDDVNPGATEACNGVDDDCSGTVDDAYAADALTWYADADGDGYGDAASTDTACSAPSGFVGDATDCDDGEAAVNPGSIEVCDGADNDCDGLVDDDDPSSTGVGSWYADADGDGYGSSAYHLESCAQPPGYVADGTDCDDLSAGVYPGADEYCDGADNDCDGDVDEVGAVDGVLRFADVDGDGYGDAGSTALACDTASGYLDDDTDCDDRDPGVQPWAGDAWGDGVDGDCDGIDGEADWYDSESYFALIPEGSLTWLEAQDACWAMGYDDLASVQDRVEMSTLLEMAVDSGIDAGFRNGFFIGLTDAASEGDFVWSDGLGGTWTNWGSGEPNDSGGEDCAYFVPTTGAWNDIACTSVESTRAYTCELRLSDVSASDDDGDGLTEAGGDCDDTDATSFPGATEWCDGVDNDCDGVADDELPVWYADMDGDGFGDVASTTGACAQPSGYVADDTDCDDAASSTYPGAPELESDGVDNDCDGYTDILTVDATTATLTAGAYTYDEVRVTHGGTLYLEGEVEIEATVLTVDATSAIDGAAAGEAGGVGTTDGSGSGAGGAGYFAGSGGGGYGGAGGLGGYDSGIDVPGAGGATYGDASSESVLAGSGGGGMDSARGGAGGGALTVYAGSITVDGTLRVTGGAGVMDTDPYSYRASGGGSGGGLLLVGDILVIGGLLDASGGDGGSLPTSAASDGGGGGGGGRIKLFYGTSLSFTGTYDVTGGAGGCCGAVAYGEAGADGTYYEVQQAY